MTSTYFMGANDFLKRIASASINALLLIWNDLFSQFFVWPGVEIYRIVSQKQMRDPPEGDTIRPNVEPIDVKPTVNTDSVRKQCCQ